MTGAASTLLALVAALQVASHQETRVWGSDQGAVPASASTSDSTARTPSGSSYTYGETASDPSSQYNGRVYDPGTGFHDYGARMYWPQIGRFISADSYLGDIANPASLNRYSYVHNNPYKYVDPDGHDPVQSRILQNPVSFDYLQRSGLAGDVSVQYLSERGLLRDALASGGASLQGMQVSEQNLLDVENAVVNTVLPLLAGIGLSSGGAGEPAAPQQGAGAKGLGNPFKGKSAEKIDKMFKRKGFESRGPDPAGGKGGYVDPKTGRSYHIDEANSYGEAPHVDVNRPRDYKGSLPKKKLEMGDK